MALDTSGNIAVDFVWGNMPLQPDTNRLDSAAEPSAALVAVQALGSGVFINTAAGVSANDFAPGDKVVISGTYTAWDGEYTVDSSQNTSPSGVTIIAPSISFRAPLGVAGYPAVPAGALVTKSVSGNFGGGAGDKGWSRTTKKKSVKLDPTLDSHNIATEFWNNFPDHTPNAGFVPQEVFRFTSKQGSLYQWNINPENTVDEYYSRGYTFTLNSSVITVEELATLNELAASGALIAQRVPAFTVLDSYGNSISIQEGFIAGVDSTPVIGMYGEGATYTIAIKVAVPNFLGFPSSPIYPPAGTEIVLGVGTPKQIVATGTIGVDMVSAYLEGFPGQNPVWRVYGTTWGTMDPNAFVGGYIATDALSDDPNAGMFLNKWDLNTNITKIGSVQFTDSYGQPFIDMYGNNYVMIYAETYTNGVNLSLPSFTANEGTKLVVIK